MRSTPAIALLIFLTALSACSHAPAPRSIPVVRTIVLSADAFGPPSMANQLPGNEPPAYGLAAFRPVMTSSSRYVVYRGTSREDIAQAYPNDPAGGASYQYVDYNDAVAYLAAHIAELKKAPVPEDQVLTTLMMTQNRIAFALNAGRAP